jgi:hypothetical protein
MNIAELEAEHGLTFHDSLLRGLSTDFTSRTVEFVLEVCVGDPKAATEQERERRRVARLELTGLQYFVIDPPDPSYPYRDEGPVDVDPCDADQDLAARYRMPESAFAGRLFVSDWNGYIHFAATNAALTWLDPE